MFFSSRCDAAQLSNQPPALVVTVDTEEEGLWSGRFVRDGNQATNVALGLPRFQQLCDRYAIKPTYLVDAPVLADRQAVDLLHGLAEADACEIGAHLHPWCTPPFDEPLGSYTSFLCNLEPSLQRAKIEWLTEKIQHVLGVRPTSFRAGRYGIGTAALSALQDLGYVADSSVLPFADYTDIGGPDFTDAPILPFLPLCAPSRDGQLTKNLPAVPRAHCDKPSAHCSITGTKPSSIIQRRVEVTRVDESVPPLVEVPVTSGYTRWPFYRWHYVKCCIRRWGGAVLRLPGILDRLNVIRYVKFSPEQATGARLRQLADIYCAHRLPVMVMMLHSSSLVAGLSPYCRNERELEDIYERLAGIFDYCIRQRNMPPMRLTEYARYVQPHLPSGGSHV